VKVLDEYYVAAFDYTTRHYTNSVDDALTLVPSGWRTNWAGQVPLAEQWFWELIEINGGGITDRVWKDTAPLAICIVALKARQSVIGDKSKTL